jgi:hypothetical protein
MAKRLPLISASRADVIRGEPSRFEKILSQPSATRVA